MAMVKSSSSHTADDQVDSDFFDQLANDFGAGDLGPLQSDLHQGEGDRLDDAFSKLILGDEYCPPITCSTTDGLVSSPGTKEIGKKNSNELAPCVKDDSAEEKFVTTEARNLADEALLTASNSSIESLCHVNVGLEASRVHCGPVNVYTESDHSAETQPTVAESSTSPALANDIAAVDMSIERRKGTGLELFGLNDAKAPDTHLNTSLPSFETSPSNVLSTKDNDSKEASYSMPAQNDSLVFGDGAPFVAIGHSQLETSAITMIDASTDRTSVGDFNAQSSPNLDVGGDTGPCNVKELQWSSFGNSYIPDAFGSYSDFFTELGSEILVDSNQHITAPIVGDPTKTFADPSAVLSSQETFGESFPLQAGPYGAASFDHFDERALWNQKGINIGVVDQQDRFGYSNYGTTSSELQHDIGSKQSGENFPLQAGPYYGASLDDFDESVLWNQKGVNVGVVERDRFGSSNYGTASSEQQHDIGSKQSGIHREEVPEIGSANDMPSSVNYEAQLQEETQQNWENMYPGWYFDYASNEWKQIEGWSTEQAQHLMKEEGDGKISQPSESSQSIAMASNSLWQSDQGQNFWPNQGSDHVLTTGAPAANDDKVPGSSSLPENLTSWEQQYPGWYFDYQSQQWYQIADSSQHWGSNHDPETSQDVQVVQNLQSSGGERIDQQGQHHYQSELNQSIHASERTTTFHGSSGGSDTNTFSQGMPFKSWAEPTTDGLEFSTQGMDKFKLDGGASPWTGFQGADKNASYHAYQAMTDSVNQFQDPAISDKHALVGSSHGFFQSHTTATHSAGQEISSAGRPSHALVAFGFGGKLLTMKAPHLGHAEPIVFQDLNHLVSLAESQNGISPYFSTLNRVGLTGPLQGCSSKDVLRWVDERIESSRKEDFQEVNSEGIHLMWGVLKIACQHYGKLRSVAGSAGIKSQMEEGPGVALGRLLSTTKGGSTWNQGLAIAPDVSHLFPTVHQLQAAVNEVRNQLMDGKIQEALQIAQRGQLWGLALVLAWQLGEKVYADTVLQMAQKQFSPGSPMRTLLLLFAGQASELFKVQSLSSSAGSLGSFTMNSSNSQWQDSAGGMLSDWLGNLSIIAANPTKGDEQVIIHLGDSLWKDQGEVAGAHMCYLVADTSFESFSKEARLCLVGADHFKFQRTFATPQAIQRTEVYEYAKTLGNPQYVLVPFQPFKLLYAHMLAEAGRITEANRYCQMVIKHLKSAGRGSDIEFCKHSAVELEERLRLHSQGGYNLNFSTGKLVGKVMGTIDSTIHKIIGGPPLPQQVAPVFTSPKEEWYANDRNVGLAAKAPMIPSASNSSLSSVNTPVDVPTRSVSEPNLIRSSSQESRVEDVSGTSFTSPSPSRLKSGGTTGGYLGRFGSQLFTKARGLMIRHSKEAKLGDENKFYYNEKLKRWVEAGAEQSAEEAVLAPPPIVSTFNSSLASPSNVKSGEELRSTSVVSSSADLPPIPPSINQFSARGRLHGVRSRYVDTFNKGNAQVAARPSPSPVVTAGGGRAAAGSPSQFFPSLSFTAAANGSLGELSSGQNNDGSKDLQTPASDNDKSGDVQVENEPLLPKNLNLSFMDVPLIRKHSSTGNMSDDYSQVKANSSSLGSVARAVSWSGESPNIFHQKHLSNGIMADTQVMTSLNAAAIPLLPSPPVFEPPQSYTGNKSGQMQTVTAEGMFSAGSLHGAASLGEMREVEL